MLRKKEAENNLKINKFRDFSVPVWRADSTNCQANQACVKKDKIVINWKGSSHVPRHRILQASPLAFTALNWSMRVEASSCSRTEVPSLGTTVRQELR